MTDHAKRTAAANAALSAYANDGRALTRECARLVDLRRLMESPLISVEFGAIRDDGYGGKKFVARRSSNQKPILLSNTTTAPTVDVEIANARADQIVGPGLRACMMMWLAEQERALRTAEEEYARRDPIAEMNAAAGAS